MAENAYEGMFILDAGRYGRDSEAVAGQIPKMIRDAGGCLFCDTCPTNSMRVEAKRIVTSGFKQAHYARNMIKAEVIVGHVEACLDAALTGRWSNGR